MNLNDIKPRRLGFAAVLAALGTLVLAPQAHAEITSLQDPGFTPDKLPCVVHCRITAHLSANSADEVTFTVNGKVIGTATPTRAGNDVTAAIAWAAPDLGNYEITATQGKHTKSTTYVVGGFDPSKVAQKK